MYKVMGPERHGRLRGLGLGPTLSSHPGYGPSISFVGASRLEDAQDMAVLKAELTQSWFKT
jgi:hypothetical protein